MEVNFVERTEWSDAKAEVFNGGGGFGGGDGNEGNGGGGNWGDDSHDEHQEPYAGAVIGFFAGMYPGMVASLIAGDKLADITGDHSKDIDSYIEIATVFTPLVAVVGLCSFIGHRIQKRFER